MIKASHARNQNSIVKEQKCTVVEKRKSFTLPVRVSITIIIIMAPYVGHTHMEMLSYGLHTCPTHDVVCGGFGYSEVKRPCISCEATYNRYFIVFGKYNIDQHEGLQKAKKKFSETAKM